MRLISWLSRAPRPASSERAFRRFLSRNGVAFESAAAGEVLRMALRWYAEQRVAGVVANEGDKLLFQWGCYDWGEGEAFELGLTRHFHTAHPHTPMSQLHTTFRYAPDAELRALGAGDSWLHDPGELAAFGDHVLAHSATNTAARRSPVTREVQWTLV